VNITRRVKFGIVATVTRRVVLLFQLLSYLYMQKDRLTEAVHILRHFSEWRLGAEIPMIRPEDVTAALAIILQYFEQNHGKK